MGTVCQGITGKWFGFRQIAAPGPISATQKQSPFASGDRSYSQALGSGHRSQDCGPSGSLSVQLSSPYRYFSSPYTSTSPLAPKYTRPLTTTGITNRVAIAARSRLLFCSDV